ncbi:hypothetical protein OVA11_19715, partial [Caulobacter sp. SL161]|uniref:hypothetical protein n=1 Tax=Caulobacter sp. SL161 TaxID=2995156 RepID=UPI00227273B5
MSQEPIETAPAQIEPSVAWSTCPLGGEQALELQWRLSTKQDQAVEWRLFKHAPANPSLVAEGLLDRLKTIT